MTTRADVESIARDAEIDGRWEDACTIRAEAHAIEPHPIDPDKCSETPMRRFRLDDAWHSWHGNLISLDGASTDDFNLYESPSTTVIESDVDEILAYGETAPGWDGNAAGVLRLKGRKALRNRVGVGLRSDGLGLLGGRVRRDRRHRVRAHAR